MSKFVKVTLLNPSRLVKDGHSFVNVSHIISMCRINTPNNTGHTLLTMSNASEDQYKEVKETPAQLNKQLNN